MRKEILHLDTPELSEARKNPVFWMAYGAYDQIKEASHTLGVPLDSDGKVLETIFLTREEVMIFTEILSNHPNVHSNPDIATELQGVQRAQEMNNCFVALRRDEMQGTYFLYVSISMKAEDGKSSYVVGIERGGNNSVFLHIPEKLSVPNNRTPSYTTDAPFIHGLQAIARMRQNDAHAFLGMIPGN